MIRFRQSLSLCLPGDQTVCWRHCNSAFYCHHSSATQLAFQDITTSEMNNSTERTITTLMKARNQTGIGPALKNTKKYICKSVHFRLYRHAFQFTGPLAFLTAFCQISAWIPKKDFVSEVWHKSWSTYHVSPLSQEYCAAGISKTIHRPTRRLLIMPLGSFLSYSLKPSQRSLHRVQLRVKEEGEDLGFNIEEIVKRQFCKCW